MKVIFHFLVGEGREWGLLKKIYELIYLIKWYIIIQILKYMEVDYDS